MPKGFNSSLEPKDGTGRTRRCEELHKNRAGTGPGRHLANACWMHQGQARAAAGQGFRVGPDLPGPCLWALSMAGAHSEHLRPFQPWGQLRPPPAPPWHPGRVHLSSAGLAGALLCLSLQGGGYLNRMVTLGRAGGLLTQHPQGGESREE